MFGRSRPVPAVSPRTIGYDTHCHILPSVDDGARHIEDSIASIKVLKGLGYRGAVLTPHIYREVFDNVESNLIEQFEAFRRQIEDEAEGFDLRLGAEYLLDDQFLERLYTRPDQLLTFGGPVRKLLIEFSGLVEPLNTIELLDECRRQNIQPIIAHVERYAFVIDDRENQRLKLWRHHGALLQMNVGSIAGQYGSTIQRTARTLWRYSLIDLLGTDLHRPEGTRRFLRQGWEYLQKKAISFDPSHHLGLFETTDG